MQPVVSRKGNEMTTESLIIRQETDLAQRRTNERSSRFYPLARGWMSGVLLLCDVSGLILALALALGLLLRFRVDFSIYSNLLGVLLAAFLIIFWRIGLYPAIGMSYPEELRRIVEAASFAFLITVAYTFLAKNATVYSRLTILFAWALSLAFVPILRYFVRRVLCNLGIWGEPVFIIGDLDKALPLVRYLKKKSQMGLRPIAVLRKDGCKSAFSSKYPCLSPQEMARAAHRMHISTALVVVNDMNTIDRTVEKYRAIFPSVILIKHQISGWGLGSLKSLDFGDVLGLQVRNNLLSPWSQLLKRTIDITAAALGLLFLSLPLALVCLLIRLDSPGPVFYRQPRLGRGGKTLSMLKFRTMHQHADQMLQQRLAADPALREEWRLYQKLKDDPRITRFGRWLRKFSLDELPQIWNVLIGEMSLVGPRPMMLDQKSLYGDEISDYVRVTPGITGLWQISGRNQTTFIRRAQLDCEYIQKWSVWLDIYVLILTVRVVLFREGAY
jgi:Undecaprenyl-phosphate galactose phosphotransferase WbaP